MRSFDQDALRELMTFDRGPAVSIYLPTHAQVPLSDGQDRLHFRNALDRAQIRLQDFGLAAAAAEEMLAPAGELLGDTRFWSHQSRGLAVFAAEDFFRAYRLPIDFDEHVLVHKHFHIPPLMPFFDGLRPFFVLALSQKQVRLYKADKHLLEEVPQQDLPHSLAEVLADFSFGKEQLHVSASSADGSLVQQGEETYGHKQQLATFCQRIDQALQDLLQATRAPLVLAAVDYVAAIYRQVSHYPAIVPETLSGNPEHTPLTQLHSRALALVEPLLAREHAAAVAHFATLSDTERIVCRTSEVVKAAFGSQIETLFLLSETGPSGCVSADGQLQTRSERGKEDDLVNLATIYTLQNGGRVYSVAADELVEVPHRVNGHQLAAILRW